MKQKEYSDYLNNKYDPILAPGKASESFGGLGPEGERCPFSFEEF